MMFGKFFEKEQQQHAPEQKPLESSLLKDLKLPQQKEEIEYLFIEEHPFGKKTPRPTGSFGPLPMRTNSDKLLYGTGALYMIGLGSGGAYGLYRGLSVASGKSFKLRFNSVLNQVTRYGPFAANSLGVLTMSWALLDIALENIRGKSDYFNHIGAAATVGLLFKSTAGLRPAVVSAALFSGVVGAYGLWENRSNMKKEMRFSPMNA